MTKNRMHLIDTNNTVISTNYLGRLSEGAPPLEVLREMIGCKWIEHVSVLWKGERKSMFVNEEGLLEDRMINPKATRIYWNATLQRMHHPQLIYADLDKPPAFTLEESGIAYLFLSTASHIVGKAVLWEGDFE